MHSQQSNEAYAEFRRVLAYLGERGVSFCDRDGDPIPPVGHTLRKIADDYASRAAAMTGERS